MIYHCVTIGFLMYDFWGFYDKRNYHVMALNVYFIQPSKIQNSVM